MWNMHDKEFEAVSKLSGEQRYAYFIKKVADWEVVWSLRSKTGWILASDNNERESIPVWPHPRFAEACRNDNWADTEPVSIPLADWLEKWLPGATADNRSIAVFLTANSTGVVVTSDRLRVDLEAEISLYEG